VVDRRRGGIIKSLRKEVDPMPKYLVRVFEPTIFEIDASSAQEAKQEALKRYNMCMMVGRKTRGLSQKCKFRKSSSFSPHCSELIF
jgi:hypothetical protein